MNDAHDITGLVIAIVILGATLWWIQGHFIRLTNLTGQVYKGSRIIRMGAWVGTIIILTSVFWPKISSKLKAVGAAKPEAKEAVVKVPTAPNQVRSEQINLEPQEVVGVVTNYSENFGFKDLTGKVMMEITGGRKFLLTPQKPNDKFGVVMKDRDGYTFKLWSAEGTSVTLTLQRWYGALDKDKVPMRTIGRLR